MGPARDGEPCLRSPLHHFENHFASRGWGLARPLHRSGQHHGCLPRDTRDNTGSGWPSGMAGPRAARVQTGKLGSIGACGAKSAGHNRTCVECQGTETTAARMTGRPGRSCGDNGNRILSQLRPRIIVDGVFFQYQFSGIARVWTALLEEWAKSGFIEHVVFLDRRHSDVPRIPGLRYKRIEMHDYGRTGADSLALERICRELDADLFVSTYYTTPTATPSFFLATT